MAGGVRGPLLLGGAAVLLLALAGCSGAPALLVHVRSGTAADPAALELAWSTPASQPDWVPADATSIEWIAETRGGADRAPAAVRLRSRAALPASCAPAADPAPVAISASWAPAAPAGAVRCGDWAVVAVPGGWYGWTPATAGTMEG